ncbi:MAG TPA: hypothetical protein VGQ90_10665 [Stellaceae bacterium]|jgi:hypothetical protein|nr:hypothetical protein [Stellaceae bacterium]
MPGDDGKLRADTDAANGRGASVGALFDSGGAASLSNINDAMVS